MFYINKNNYILITLLIICLLCIQITAAQCIGSSCGGGSCTMASSTSGSCCGLDTKKTGTMSCGSGMGDKMSMMSSCGSESNTKSISMAKGCGGTTSCSSGSGCGSSSSMNANNPSNGCGPNDGCGGEGSCGSPSVSMVKQDSRIVADKGCGGRSLAYIASQEGIKIDESKIIEMIKYDPDKGASMMDIVNAAKKLGLYASGYKMNYDQLEKRELPVIVYLPDHFTVLVSMDDSKNTLTFTDSSKRKVTLTKEEFLKKWQGYVLEIRKEPQVSLAQ